MRHPVYIYLTIAETSAGGRSIVTLPGQKRGGKAILANVRVKDAAGSNCIEKSKRTNKIGEVFFTTTLKESSNCYVARDIYRLRDNDTVLYPDAMEKYQNLINKKQ